MFVLFVKYSWFFSCQAHSRCIFAIAIGVGGHIMVLAAAVPAQVSEGL